MRRINALGTAALLVLALAPSAADATFITGTFEGSVRQFFNIPQPDGPPIQIIEVAPVTGSFAFETDPRLIPQPPVRDPEIYPNGASYFGATMSMAYATATSSWLFDNSIDAFGGPRLDFGTNGNSDLLGLEVAGPYWYSRMEFVGAPGALFDDVDILTFNPLGVSLANSSARFSGDIRSEHNEVRFDRITFDGYGTVGVPTPGGLALFGIGLVALVATHRSRRRSVSQVRFANCTARFR